MHANKPKYTEVMRQNSRIIIRVKKGQQQQESGGGDPMKDYISAKKGKKAKKDKETKSNEDINNYNYNYD